MDVEAADPELEWYGNLLWFERRKCLLVTHAATLFSVFIPDVRKKDLTPIGPFITRQIEAALAVESLPPNAIGQLDPDDVRIAKTASRTVLGCMNDMAWGIENTVMGEGGLANADIENLNRQLRRFINSPSGYQRPVDVVRVRVRLRIQRGTDTSNDL